MSRFIGGGDNGGSGGNGGGYGGYGRGGGGYQKSYGGGNGGRGGYSSGGSGYNNRPSYSSGNNKFINNGSNNYNNNNEEHKNDHNAYSDDEGNLGERLNDIDYSKMQLKPFQKVFYQVGKSIHTDEEISAYQKEKGIIIRSKHDQIPQPFITWVETKFPKYIMSVIEDSKFSDPMPIQAQSFPIVLSGHDLIGIAQTGSGKTLSFILPALVHINAQDPVKAGEGPIALVLAPTRELANQIQEQCHKFGSRCKISSVCVYGGAPKSYQERDLRNGMDVVIATPGRLIDFLESNVIDLKRVTYLVLDEADRMLDMGFEPSIRKIVGQIRPDRQTLMFSATWPQSVRKLALDFCQANPIHIQIGSMENNVNTDIEQTVEILPKGQKYLRLKEILQQQNRQDKSIIFTQTKKDCDDLSEALYSESIRNACIHGDKSQRDRDKVMDLFKTGRINTLIATDVASRGLDVKDIKLVINFDFPKQIEDYVHRVGRTGRAGAVGKAISFLDKYEDKRIAKELVDVLKQNDQFITDELLDLADYNSRGFGNNRGGGGNRGGFNKFANNNNGGGNGGYNSGSRYGGQNGGSNQSQGNRQGGQEFQGRRNDDSSNNSGNSNSNNNNNFNSTNGGQSNSSYGPPKRMGFFSSNGKKD